MSAFSEASKVEREGTVHILKYLDACGYAGKYQLTENQKFLQKYVGDVVLAVGSIEFKVEKSDKHGNLFLETWSNKSRFTPGWMYTTQADFLWCYFVAQRSLHEMKMKDLREWAFGVDNICGHVYSYPEKRQRKYTQLNDTWGWCVPYDVLERSMPSYKKTNIRSSLEPQGGPFESQENTNQETWFDTWGPGDFPDGNQLNAEIRKQEAGGGI